MNDFVDQQKAVNIAIALIITILAFIVPAAIIYPAKSSFITTQAEEIGTSPLALLTGGIGLLALAGIFVTLAVIEKRLKKWLVLIILAVITFTGLALSMKDYYYMTPEHFVLNESFSLNAKVYEWDDFESVEEVITKVDGTTAVEKIILHMKDNKKYSYSGGAMVLMYSTISSRVVSAGGEHIRTKQ